MPEIQAYGHIEEFRKYPGPTRQLKVLRLARRLLQSARFSGATEISMGADEFATLCTMIVGPSTRIIILEIVKYLFWAALIGLIAWRGIF